VRRTLGDHCFERFVTNKLNEWYEYREHVTDFEIKRYFSKL
jgi:glutamine synthetase